MVKRCAASNCYNSQMTNKIAYFGFPRNEAVAKEWALRAGREDLMEKKIDNLTKYHLCSDHFSNDAFLDPKVEDKTFLKLKKHPTIPVPTIFENNLMKNVEKVAKNPEKFASYSKHTAFETINHDNLNKLHHKRIKINEKKEIKKIEEPPIREEYLEDDIEIEQAAEPEVIDINQYCRLCGSISPEMMAIFSDEGDFHAETSCIRLMPEGMIAFNDGLPQNVCFECIDKLQSCSNIIDGFVENQSMFVSE